MHIIKILFLTLCLAVFNFSVAMAQDEQVVSVEERVVISGFAVFNAALAFDQVCNGRDPKEMFDLNKPENINLLGNQQLLAGRYGGLLHNRYPDQPDKVILKKMLLIADQMQKKTSAQLRADGCDSEAGISLSKAWDLYSKSAPEHINRFIDQKITDEGGTITANDHANHNHE